MLVVGAILAGIGAGTLVWLGFRDQRVLWWRWQSRQYRNPEANEPSDSAYTGQRVLLFLLAAFMAVGAVVLANSADTISLSDGEVRAAADEAASALSSGDPVLMGPATGYDSFEPYVESAVRDAGSADGNGVPLELSRGEEAAVPPGPQRKGDEIVEHYTVSGDGGHAVCMTVTGTNIGEYPSPYGPAPEPAYEYTLSATAKDGDC
jgi:hypothetical protein